MSAGRARHGRRSAGACIAALLISAAGCSHGEADAAALTHGGSAARGKLLIDAYGCGSCHTIPRVRGATATVGPNLTGIASRDYIAGVLPNTPENMMRWIRNPQGIDDKTAMPTLGVSESDARHIAAYLYTLK